MTRLDMATKYRKRMLRGNPNDPQEMKRIRSSYTYGVVRDTSQGIVRPENISATGQYARLSFRGYDEWWFEHEEDRNRFIQTYKGTAL